MPAIFRLPPVLLSSLMLLLGCSGLNSADAAADNHGTGEASRAAFQRAPASASPAPAATPPAASAEAPAVQDQHYPHYMPMDGLRRPAHHFLVRCEASRAAGREVYAGRDAASLYGRAEGGFEFVYEALDSTGRPCIYPFEPTLPQLSGNLDGTQYIVRSSIPGRRVTFATNDQWASLSLRAMDIGRQRIHFEMRDIELDFPGAIQTMGALHLEAFGGARPGLFTAVIRRSKIFGGKNAIFVPAGQTMLLVENSEIAGNVGTNVDQEHSSYINGIIVSHLRNSSWRGQLTWVNIASGHQLKDKSYLRIYENVTVSNQSEAAAPSAMALIDATAYGFTWSNNLHLRRLAPAQTARDVLVDIRTDMVYGAPDLYPWNILADTNWHMPAQPLTALDQVYLSVYHNTVVESFRTEPSIFTLRPLGTHFSGEALIEGNDHTARADQRAVAIAFNTRGRMAHVFAPGGWTYTDPQLPANARWIMDRDAFIDHALGLIGR